MKSIHLKIVLSLVLLFAGSRIQAQQTMDTLYFRDTPVLIDEFVFVTDTLHVAWYPDTLKCFTEQRGIHVSCKRDSAAWGLPDHFDFNLTADSINKVLASFRDGKYNNASVFQYSTTAQPVTFTPEDLTKPLPEISDNRARYHYYTARIQYLTNLLQANPDSCNLYILRAEGINSVTIAWLNIENQYSADLMSAIQCNPHDIRPVLLRTEQLVEIARFMGAAIQSTQCINHSIIDHTYLKEAVDLLEKSLTFNPQSPELIQELNKCYSLQKGDF